MPMLMASVIALGNAPYLLSLSRARDIECTFMVYLLRPQSKLHFVDHNQYLAEKVHSTSWC